ncbi:uncharacterized protein [Asterias amurensis]|uniref:uncharacterized protein n=1 Tax=Asterias amurensis TaxID=7602 RepID=UPI003AB53018
MNVVNINLNFPRKRESCLDCGGQVWNVRKELSFSGKDTCVDCGELAGTCPHWLHLYTYIEPLNLMPLFHGIQKTPLRFHLEKNASLEIHSDLFLQTPWSETPLSPSPTLRSKFGYRCQFSPVWSSTGASHPLGQSKLGGKITPSQVVTQIHQLQTTPSVSNLQQEICQQQQYPYQQLQQEQHQEQQQPQQQKHKQKKPQSLQRKLQQVPANKPATASPKTSQEAKTPDAAKTEAKSAPATTSIVSASTRSVQAQTQSATASSTPTEVNVSHSPPAAAVETGSTGKVTATAAPTAAAVPKVVASSIQNQSATATSTPTNGKVSLSPGAAVETGSTDEAAATVAPTASAVSKAVAPAAAIETGSTGKADATAAPTSTSVAEAVAPPAATDAGSTGKAAATPTPTASVVLKVVASTIQPQTTSEVKPSRAQTLSLALPSSTFEKTTSLKSRSLSEVKSTAPESKCAVPVQQTAAETPKPESAAEALPAGAAAASTTSSQESSPGQQQSEHTSPKQPEQLLSPVTQALDNYLQGIDIPSIEQSDLEHPPQGQVVLGQGNYGGVLMMLYNNEHVAVKCVPTGGKNTVDREVRILSLLSEHDSFPNLHGTVECGQFRAVAMQFIGDEASATCLTLGEALNGSRSLTLNPSEWTSIAMNVVDGIKYMHSEGLLHNDIKMDNILMTYDTQKHLWRAYVIDVGMATTTNTPRNYVLTSEEKEKYRKFHAHIAPEMVDNGKHRSTRSDTFQLGCVLHSIGQFGAVPFLEQLGNKCKSRDPVQRPEITHIRFVG